MKTFQVQIEKNRTDKECSFVWPTWWGEVNEDVDVIAYEDHPESLGKHSEGCVCVCEDGVWVKIAAKKDKAITLLTETAANDKGRAWRPQITKVTDETKVLLITAKVALGKALSTDEREALNPDKETPGVGKSPLFDVRKICQDKGGDLVEADLQA